MRSLYYFKQYYFPFQLFPEAVYQTDSLLIIRGYPNDGQPLLIQICNNMERLYYAPLVCA